MVQEEKGPFDLKGGKMIVVEVLSEGTRGNVHFGTVGVDLFVLERKSGTFPPCPNAKNQN